MKVLEDEFTPALFNDEKLVERVLPSLRKAIGAENLVLVRAGHGGRGLQPLRPGGRADLHVPPGVGRTETPGGSTHGRADIPVAALGGVLSRRRTDLQTGITAMATAVLDLLPPKK